MSSLNLDAKVDRDMATSCAKDAMVHRRRDGLWSSARTRPICGSRAAASHPDSAVSTFSSKYVRTA